MHEGATQIGTRACAAAAGLYCGLGFTVPVAPTAVAIMAVVLVRSLVWTRTRSAAWNIGVCGLAMLAAFATVEGSQISVFQGFCLGVGYGALGVGIIEIGKGAVARGLAERFSKAATVLFGLSPRNKE